MSSSKRIAIIDYKMGNLYSVKNACKYLGLDPIITSNSKDLMEADAAILPGVGAFGEAVNNLKELNLLDPIYNYINTGRPFMGICLGFQLLFTQSQEFGVNVGLGLLNGQVKKFPGGFNDEKVPQIGWNQIQYNSDKKIENTPFSKIPEKSFMYFVHSYYVEPDSADFIISTTKYAGIEYCSSILKNNIFGTQFHPEKSGHLGLKIYQNWIKQI